MGMGEYIQRPGGGGQRPASIYYRPQRQYGAQRPAMQMPNGPPQMQGVAQPNQNGLHSQTMPYVMPGSQVPMQNASPGNRNGNGSGSFKTPFNAGTQAYPAVLQKKPQSLWAAMQAALQTPGVGANGTQVPMPMNPYMQQWASDPNGYGGGRR